MTNEEPTRPRGLLAILAFVDSKLFLIIPSRLVIFFSWLALAIAGSAFKNITCSIQPSITVRDTESNR